MNQAMSRCVVLSELEHSSVINILCVQNTMLVTGLYSYHNDPDVWGDPHIYRPERFLNENGQLKKDLTLPFGAGKWLCSLFKQHIPPSYENCDLITPLPLAKKVFSVHCLLLSEILFSDSL